MKDQRAMTLVCIDIGIKKSEFVAKIQFLCFIVRILEKTAVKIKPNQKKYYVEKSSGFNSNCLKIVRFNPNTHNS